MKVENGMNIKVHYTGKHTDGTIFDSSETRGETLTVKVGEGQVIQGFDEALLGMKVGDKKTVTIEPEKGYGDKIQEAVQELPTTQLPEGVKAGDSLQGMGPNGQPIMCVVESINGDKATVDFNHPLAGKTIVFDIELVEIN